MQTKRLKLHIPPSVASAFGGFLNYLPPISSSIAHDCGVCLIEQLVHDRGSAAPCCDDMKIEGQEETSVEEEKDKVEVRVQRFLLF